MPPSAFADQKATRIFSIFDTDGDGVAVPSDLDLASSRLGAAFGQSPGSSALQPMTQAHSGLWKLFGDGADNDGRISLAEFKAAMPGVLANPATFLSLLDSLFDALVHVADGDSDGKLTHDEYVRLYTTRAGLSADQASAAFSKLDSDSDGLVTADEIKTATREYFLSDDPGSSGSWLLGPLA